DDRAHGTAAAAARPRHPAGRGGHARHDAGHPDLRLSRELPGPPAVGRPPALSHPARSRRLVHRPPDPPALRAVAAPGLRTVPAVPLVSVIMPAYRAEGTLGRAVCSLLQQSEADWEAVIVADDLADYAGLLSGAGLGDARLRFLSSGRVGGGAPAARNIGL